MVKKAILAWALAAAAPVHAQLFDDNEARRRIELLRQQVEARNQSIEPRPSTMRSTNASRFAPVRSAVPRAWLLVKNPNR
jgi:hypothetical protein